METKPDYNRISASQNFKQLMLKKKRFLFPMTLFFLVFYFLLPVLTSYSKVLNEPAIGPISWAWMFAFAQFIMTWALCMIYSRKSVQFDKAIEEIKQEAAGRKQA
ncbi:MULTISPECIES: DUF485 domain-containing protein [Paenibacillus]|uniref:DUF485 domain-containing protein n=1 Tax=Paenibacillus TaxID=44249 RepID=UPI0008384A8A|nr:MULTISPECIES: DUF485 domain-containing protein [Paenibacillus]GIP19995.1 membrane protein [Paenibacillus sp. J22TS3]